MGPGTVEAVPGPPHPEATMTGLTPTEPLRVRYRAARTGRGPLTYGQHDTLRWLRAGASDSTPVLFWRLALPIGVSLHTVGSTLGDLVARHEALRTRFVLDPEPRQIVDGAGTLVVDVLRVEPELADAPAADLEDLLHERLRARGIDLGAGPAFRIAVAVRDGLPAAAALLVSHAAVDLASLTVLGHQFTALASGEPVPEPDYQPLDQARFESTRPCRRRSDAAVTYWTAQLRTAPQAMLPLPPPAEPTAGHLSGFLYSRAGGLALATIAARTGLARQAVMMAAVCTVVSARTGTPNWAFPVLSHNRFRDRLRDYVGALAQDGLIAFDISGADFDVVVGRVAAAVTAAGTHASYDETVLRAARDEVAQERGITFGRDFAFNGSLSDVTCDVDAPVDPGELTAALPSSRTMWLPWEPVAETLVCRPVSLGPELVLVLTGDLRHVSRDELDLLLQGTERLLVAAACDPLPLTDLTAVTGVKQVCREGWALVDSCWVQVNEVRALVAEALRVPSFVTAELVAHMPVSDEVRTPEQAHAACLTKLAGRRNVMTPVRYVLHEGVAVDPDGWTALPVAAEGRGR